LHASSTAVGGWLERIVSLTASNRRSHLTRCWDSKPRTERLPCYKLLTSRVLSGAIHKLTRQDLSAVTNRRLPAGTKKSSPHDVGARKASGRRDFLKPHPGAL